MPDSRAASIFLAIMLGLVALVGTMALLDGGPAYAVSGVLYVALDGDCQGASPCFEAIQEAVDSAADRSTIKVAQGVYTGDGEQVVSVSKAITLSGGFTTTNWQIADPENHPTVIDAENASGRRGIAINGSNVPTITLTGLTIQNGHAPYSKGGGVYIFTGTVWLIDNGIKDNTAENGGGIFLANGSLILDGNSFEGNQANWDGGAVNIGNGSVLLQGNIFHGNSASRHGGGLSL